ncbi:HNH endonuclease [Cedecea sp. P7760]|uniref:HNH endonuclease n=1 Tax=Cedecea sp. P7760 TaxID=2726983 RepID=UPI0015A0207F|nr:HNH endonuclease [Cedecea sp. P7760]NWC64012.1 HNH endonuclease [Cedecea sp. P7760]
MNLSKRKREALREQFRGCCAFCGSKLPSREWHAEFIGEDYVKGGIVAVCTECRSTKGSASPEAFRELLSQQVERAQRHSVNFRTALRFGLCRVKVSPIVFWFERCESSPAVTFSPNLATPHNPASAA